MKVVVADTSPLNYLVLVGEVELLQRLYGGVLIPDIVASELSDPDAPPAVSSWASNLPAWVEVRPTPVSSELLEKLDEGERAAILLAEAQTPPVLLLIDEADGRAEAERRHAPRYTARKRPEIHPFILTSGAERLVYLDTGRHAGDEYLASALDPCHLAAASRHAKFRG